MSNPRRLSERLARAPVLFSPSGIRLDGIDLAIMRQLQTDARAPVQAIAEQVGLSHSGALQRVRRLELSGVVLRHVADIDEGVFEPWSVLLVGLMLTLVGRGARAELDRAIQDQPEILLALETVGAYDLVLKAALPAAAAWSSLQAQLDPSATWIDKAHLLPVGRTIKRASPHPLLVQASP